MKKVVILGGRGDGVVVASCIRDAVAAGAELELSGFLNDHEKKGTEISGVPVLGRIPDAESFQDHHFITALLKAKESVRRSALIEGLGIPPERFITLIHPTAVVGTGARIESGTLIGPHVTIMPGAFIGKHCSLRASVSVGHDSIIEDFCYLGPNATLSGRCVLRKGAHLGPNSSVLDRLVVGQHSVVGIGSAVTKNVDEFTAVIGCPARVLSSVNRE